MAAIVIIVFIVVIGLLFLNLNNLIEWTTHIDMVKEHSKRNEYPIVKSNYRSFIGAMCKRKWSRQTVWSTSFFLPDNKDKTLNNYHGNYVHASIICIDGICMKLDFFSFIKFSKFIKRNKVYRDFDEWEVTKTDRIIL